MVTPGFSKRLDGFEDIEGLGAATGAVATPTLVEVALGGRRLSAADRARITEIIVRGQLGRPAQCELSFRVDDLGDPAGLTVRLGDRLSVEVRGHKDALFVGEVTVVEHDFRADGGRVMRLRCYDRMHRLRKRQSVRRHEDTDLRALAGVLAEGTGLTVDGPAISLGDVYQSGVSDLELLVEHAGRQGLYPIVDGGTLRLVTLTPGRPRVELDYGRRLHSAQVEFSAEPAYGSVAVTPWDPATAVAVQATTSSATSGPAVGDSDAAGARDGSVRVGGGGTAQRLDDPQPPGDGAQALAQAHLDAIGAARVVATFVCDGDPGIQPGRAVRVTGLTTGIDGTYLITSCVHRMDPAGYQTEIDTRPPAGPMARRRDQVTLGDVVDVADPEGRARVRVALPAYDRLETDWAPLLTAAAGDGKGLLAVPAPGDQVLVLLIAADPAYPLVLGGLYGQRAAPHVAGAEPGRDLVVRTDDGQQIALDATHGSVTLSDGHGSLVELGPDLLRISAATDVLVEAAGRSMRFRAKSVDFEEAS